jgi:short-subunit dehydrogenase
LETLAAELRRNHGVDCRVIPLDLSRDGAPKALAESVSHLDVGMLVNNAGFGAMGRFGAHEPGVLADMIHLNCAAPVLLTHHLLPRLKARTRGAVLFLASVAGYQGSPYMACYSATKAFDLIFGETLARECEGSGLDVLVVSPGTTDSEFFQVAGAIPHGGDTALSVVREALSALGRKHTVVTGFLHKLQTVSGRFFPRRFVTWAAAKVLLPMTPPEKR